MASIQKIAPCLWFDDQGEEAANFYVSIFPDSHIDEVMRYGKAGFEVHGRPEGMVMTVAFHLAGQEFLALNGGPHFRFTPAVSLIVRCDSQQEIDEYWEKLSAGGDPAAQQCGWLQDRFGLAWQVVPAELPQLLRGGAERIDHFMDAVHKMKKIDLAELRRAARGTQD